MSATSPDCLRWLEKLATLNAEGPKKAAPTMAAPHKPLLLLLVIDLVEEGKLNGGLLHRDGALVFRFATLWTVVADRRRTKPDVKLPFYHLKNDGFWNALEANGQPARARDLAFIAQIDVSFLVCLRDEEFRSLCRRTLIARYFQPTERAELYKLCGLDIPPDDLVGSDAIRFLPSDKQEKKRDAKFAVRVLPAYDFTCAFSHYRMIGLNGTTPLDAAHIHQFKGGGSCHPTNGIALSKTAHWLFDRGFWSLTDNYKILVADHLFDEAGEAAHLLKPRAGQAIHLPKSKHFYPDPECLKWHRERHKFPNS